MCCDAIDRDCFLNSLCARRSQGKCKIIADRHSFLVGLDNICQDVCELFFVDVSPFIILILGDMQPFVGAYSLESVFF